MEESEDAVKVDDGAYIRLGVRAISHRGIAPDSNWKYKDGEFKKSPTKSVQKAAERWMLGSYMRCTDVDSVINAIAGRHPVVGGYMCHTGMWTRAVDDSGFMPMPGSSDQEDGGHCTEWIGYDLDMPVPGASPGVILFKNSWGKWGNAFNHVGYGLMPIEFIRKEFADDMWALVKEA
jgi:hypothetical protein